MQPIFYPYLLYINILYVIITENYPSLVLQCI